MTIKVLNDKNDLISSKAQKLGELDSSEYNFPEYNIDIILDPSKIETGNIFLVLIVFGILDSKANRQSTKIEYSIVAGSVFSIFGESGTNADYKSDENNEYHVRIFIIK